MIDHGVKPGDRVSHLTSVHYHVALAACDHAGLYDVQHSPKRMADDVAAFMQKVSVSADPMLSSHYPDAWPARVRARTSSGSYERLVVHGWGDPPRPFDVARVEDKFRRILSSLAMGEGERLLGHAHSALDRDGSSVPLLRDIMRLSQRAVD
jgi:2-methylcitrate dehydratase PrpD